MKVGRLQARHSGSRRILKRRRRRMTRGSIEGSLKDALYAPTLGTPQFYYPLVVRLKKRRKMIRASAVYNPARAVIKLERIFHFFFFFFHIILRISYSLLPRYCFTDLPHNLIFFLLLFETFLLLFSLILVYSFSIACSSKNVEIQTSG